MAAVCHALLAAVEAMRSLGVRFVLVHESALMGWGIDNSVFLGCVDALVVRRDGFEALGLEEPSGIGQYVEAEFSGIPARLWSRESLGIRGGVEVTSCARYGCEALAPEVVLTKLPYSPDAALLAEQRARLAAILMAESLTDDELELVARYVRGCP